MRRDDDLIRSLMFEAEGHDDWRFTEAGALVIDPTPEENQRGYHLLLLVDAGLFTQVGGGVFRLTNAGHDWLDAVRDDTVWGRTKDAAGRVGGVGLNMMAAIAKGYVKQTLQEYGVPIE